MHFSKECAFCGENATNACSKCMDTYYCSNKCAINNWSTHRNICLLSSKIAGALKAVENNLDHKPSCYRDVMVLPNGIHASTKHTRVGFRIGEMYQKQLPDSTIVFMDSKSGQNGLPNLPNLKKAHETDTVFKKKFSNTLMELDKESKALSGVSREYKRFISRLCGQLLADADKNISKQGDDISLNDGDDVSRVQNFLEDDEAIDTFGEKYSQRFHETLNTKLILASNLLTNQVLLFCDNIKRYHSDLVPTVWLELVLFLMQKSLYPGTTLMIDKTYLDNHVEFSMSGYPKIYIKDPDTVRLARLLLLDQAATKELVNLLYNKVRYLSDSLLVEDPKAESEDSTKTATKKSDEKRTQNSIKSWEKEIVPLFLLPAFLNTEKIKTYKSLSQAKNDRQTSTSSSYVQIQKLEEANTLLLKQLSTTEDKISKEQNRIDKLVEKGTIAQPRESPTLRKNTRNAKNTKRQPEKTEESDDDDPDLKGLPQTYIIPIKKYKLAIQKLEEIRKTHEATIEANNKTIEKLKGGSDLSTSNTTTTTDNDNDDDPNSFFLNRAFLIPVHYHEHQIKPSYDKSDETKTEESYNISLGETNRVDFLTLIDLVATYLRKKIKDVGNASIKLEVALQPHGRIKALSGLVSIIHVDIDKFSDLQNLRQNYVDMIRVLINMQKELEGLEEPKRITMYKVGTWLLQTDTSKGKELLNAQLLGPPGTGKTTFVKYMSLLYSRMGYLSSLPMDSEPDASGRSTFISGYTGQTSIQTDAYIDGHLGRLVFIDEAYELVQNKDDGYGKEALTALTKAMTEYGPVLIIFIAGYQDAIKKNLYSANSGLPSRFNDTYNFTEYNDTVLFKFFKKRLRENSLKLNKEDKMLLKNTLFPMLTKPLAIVQSYALEKKKNSMQDSGVHDLLLLNAIKLASFEKTLFGESNIRGIQRWIDAIRTLHLGYRFYKKNFIKSAQNEVKIDTVLMALRMFVTNADRIRVTDWPEPESKIPITVENAVIILERDLDNQYSTAPSTNRLKRRSRPNPLSSSESSLSESSSGESRSTSSSEMRMEELREQLTRATEKLDTALEALKRTEAKAEERAREEARKTSPSNTKSKRNKKKSSRKPGYTLYNNSDSDYSEDSNESQQSEELQDSEETEDY